MSRRNSCRAQRSSTTTSTSLLPTHFWWGSLGFLCFFRGGSGFLLQEDLKLGLGLLCRSGASYWLPTGSTDGCFNFPPGCNVRGSGPGVPGPSCADGQCTDLGFTLDESFLHDP